MKIKRFHATTMRAALQQVREEQGPDAVILSKRRLGDGIESLIPSAASFLNAGALGP